MFEDVLGHEGFTLKSFRASKQVLSVLGLRVYGFRI